MIRKRGRAGELRTGQTGPLSDPGPWTLPAEMLWWEQKGVALSPVLTHVSGVLRPVREAVVRAGEQQPRHPPPGTQRRLCSEYVLHGTVAAG